MQKVADDGDDDDDDDDDGASDGRQGHWMPLSLLLLLPASTTTTANTRCCDNQSQDDRNTKMVPRLPQPLITMSSKSKLYGDGRILALSDQIPQDPPITVTVAAERLLTTL